MKVKNRDSKIGWNMLIVLLVLWGLFTVIPVIWSFGLTVFSYRGNEAKFVGLGNYINILSDQLFLKSFGNTLFYLIIQVPIMLLLAMVIAALLNNSSLKGRGIYRTIIFLPCVTSLITYSVLFKIMLAPDGIVNKVLMSLSIISEPTNWLGDPFWAKIVVIFALIWRWTGYNMIFYLAAMQNIPGEVYEAATVDGASKLRQFFSITIPLMKPIIIFTSITSTIGTLQLFDETMVLTKGGPGDATITLSQLVYKNLFEYSPNQGYASTIAVFIVIAAVLLALLQFKITKEETNEN
ncbi:carbohydrate ABC transporter permease [Cetobacterium somerae]|uniref:carbohydrate ABC transporter permease n=1 Tax=Cetobacterium somerae TaxID=188913 RepID=UPI00211E5675|nr:sugar ABC transporter permease [Cetobacterium somerae]WVJ03375.1 sugar ABC transporter permease [Cetobacterium somerae]